MSTEAQKAASLILKARRLKKWKSTYYDRMEDNLYDDNCYRGYWAHCNTSTGRLTSDLQQVPRKDKGSIKRMFISRYK